MSVHFRPAAPDEQPAVYALYRSLAGTPFCTWNEQYPGMLEVNNDCQTGNLFVLEEDGAIVGAISVVPENELDELPLWTLPGRAFEFARVAVAKTHQGRGLAKTLVRGAEDVMRARGGACAHILAAVGNIPALKTYRALGYRALGTCDMYGHTYYAMEKSLL